MNRIGEHAVVLGASMGGLLAARVLTEAYERVTLIERDILPEVGQNRRGVPQGRHGHALLAGGARVIDELFPGFLADLVARGAPAYSDCEHAFFAPNGHVMCRKATFPKIHQPSRPFLEGHLRARVRALPGVEILEGHDVTGLVANERRDRVTGARVVRRGGDGAEEIIGADLVVDTTGRAAHTPAWLEQLGYERPREDRLRVDVMYVGQLVRLRPDALREKIVLIGARPGRLGALALFAYENDTWSFTVGGYFGQHPKADRASMLEFAEDMAPPHVMAAIRESEPLGEVVTHRFPANQRRRYEKLRRFPDGLLAIGDAICSYNPLYGQGMSVAAQEALALRDCLRRGDRDLPRRYFRAAAKVVDVAWQFAYGADLALPEVDGPRPLPARLINRYMDWLMTAAESDPVVVEQLARVSGLVDPPARMMRPGIVWRGLVDARRRRARSRAADEAVAPAFSEVA